MAAWAAVSARTAKLVMTTDLELVAVEAYQTALIRAVMAVLEQMV